MIHALLVLFVPFAAPFAGDDAAPALNGLDPVALVRGHEVPGKADLALTRFQFRYLFANEENKTEFEARPEAYEIQMGGGCGRMGPLSGRGSPSRFLVHDGKIYVFASDPCRESFRKAPDKHLDADDPAPATTPESLAAGRALIDKAIEAAGGAKAVASVKVYRAYYLGTTVSGGKKHGVSDWVTIAYPDRVRRGNAWDETDWSEVVSGNEGFFLDSKGARTMHPCQVEAVHRDAGRELVSVLRACASGGDTVITAAGSDKIGETAVEKVAVARDGMTTTLWIDPASGRVLRSSYRGRPGAGPPGELVRTWSDFRKAGALTVPFTVATTWDGKPVEAMSRTLAAIEIDPEIDPTMFDRPAAAGAR